MSAKRIEWEFNSPQLMRDIRRRFPSGASLRDISAGASISVSTLSRIDNGHSLDMNTFMTICSHYDLRPGEYFVRVVWQRVDGDDQEGAQS